MEAKLRSCWQKVRKPLEIFVIVVGCILMITLLVVIALTYIFGVNVPGLRGKTLWDWLQLLIIPAVLAVGGYLFNYSTSRNERNAADRHNQAEREIAEDNQREAALQEYINNMSELLLERKLRESTEDAEVRTIARVRTLTVLPRLDPIRKRSVLQFLHESGLIDKNKPIIDLSGANLREVDLREADLSGANLKSADLRRADLSGANLTGTILSGTTLTRAILCFVNLTEADLNRAILCDANLTGTILRNVDLSRANLIEAYFGAAKLWETNLNGANLSGAYFGGADLSGANLKDATGITIKKLEKQAKSLKGATMPNGSIHP